jgi:hypothetical protein
LSHIVQTALRAFSADLLIGTVESRIPKETAVHFFSLTGVEYFTGDTSVLRGFFGDDSAVAHEADGP